MEKVNEVFLVIGDPLNEDDNYIIFAVCDSKDLSASFCGEVIDLIGRDIRRVYVSEYPLNCLQCI